VLAYSDGDEEYTSLDKMHCFSIPAGATLDGRPQATENVGTSLQNVKPHETSINPTTNSPSAIS